MRDELKTALDKVTADDALRQSTRAFLARQTHDYGAAKARPRAARRMAAAFACLALVVAGGTGYWAYFSPTCAISIDINPSVELAVNRFDKVISVDGIGKDGDALAESLDVRFLNYADALDCCPLRSRATIRGRRTPFWRRPKPAPRAQTMSTAARPARKKSSRRMKPGCLSANMKRFSLCRRSTPASPRKTCRD